MKLKALYNSLEDIPEQYRDLYEERGGQYHLTQIEGVKTEADVSRVQRALESERTAHSQLKTQWQDFFGDKKPEDVQATLDRVPELEAAAEGKMDDEKVEQLVSSRLQTKLAPVQRELDQTKRQLDEANGKVQDFEKKETQRTIHDAVRKAAQESKVIDTAQDDVLMLAERMFEVGEDGSITAKEGVGVTPGVTPDVWLTEMQQKRPHWWPPSQGSGATGSGSGGGFPQNPWSKDNWNLTKQGEVIRTQGAEKAAQMAKSAGSFVGASKPPAAE